MPDTPTPPAPVDALATHPATAGDAAAEPPAPTRADEVPVVSPALMDTTEPAEPPATEVAAPSSAMDTPATPTEVTEAAPEGHDGQAAEHIEGAAEDTPGEDAGAAQPSGAPALPELGPAACAAALAERFPALFHAGRALPLKLRIQADIQARAPGVFTRKSLSLFLHRHTTSTAYLRALVNIPTRHDLDGQPAGEVAEEHRAAATAEVERRRTIVEARRLAEREAQRQAQRQAQAAQRAAAGPPGTAEAGASEVGPAAGGVPAPRRDRPPRGERPPRPGPGFAGPRADAAATGQRPPQGERPPRPPRPDRADRPPRPPRAEVAPQERAHAIGDNPAPGETRTSVPQGPQLSAAELDARRERAALLRAYESSTLTRANFCVLKRIAESELEAQLVQARKEREERGPDPRQGARPEGAERPTRPDRPERGPWAGDRGPRPGGPGGPGGRGGRDAPRAPLPAGERTRPAQGTPVPGHKPPVKPTR